MSKIVIVDKNDKIIDSKKGDSSHFGFSRCVLGEMALFKENKKTLA